MEFSLEYSEHIALCDLLKVTGLCENGGHAKTVIANGEVKVNGQVCTIKRLKIHPNDLIEFNGEKIKVV